MECEVCGAELSAEALEANSCLKCGAIIDIDAPFKDVSEYKRKAEFVDSIQNLMNTNLTVNRSQEIQKQENLKKVNDAFEYHAEIIASNPDGTVSSEKLNSQLRVFAEKGWRLANSFCNVIGKSQVAGYGGVTGGLAANGSVPITQIILIFERRTGAARRPMPPQGQPGMPMPPQPGMPMPPQGQPGQMRPATPPQGQPAVQPATPGAGGDMFAGKRPTPRPMTEAEKAQLNKQQPLPGTAPQAGMKPSDDNGNSGDDGKPRIIPLR